MVSDLIRVGPEAAIAGSGRIDDVDVPAADKGVSLGVQDLEHDDVELPRCQPRLQGAHLAGPAVDQVGWIQAAEQDDVLHALQDVVRHNGNGVRVGVNRLEYRSGGKECVTSCRPRWCSLHKQKNKNNMA